MFQKQHNKALDYCNLSIFHDPQYNATQKLKTSILNKENISKEELNKIVTQSIRITRLISSFDHIKLSDNNHRQNLYCQSNNYLHLNNLDKAEITLKNYVTTHNKNNSAFCDLGRILIHQKKYKEATKPLLQSISLSQNNFLAYFWLGIASIMLNKHKIAAQHLTKALTIINSEHDQYHKNFSQQYYLRASLHHKLNETELSLNDLNKSLELNHSNADALFLRSTISISKSNIIDAITDIEKIEKHHSNHTKLKKLKIDLRKLEKELQNLS
jgi:tetratricopeptide (TPR) repeat protein